MRYALLVLIVAGTARETHAQGTPIQNGVPYHVGTDGVVYLHGPTEVTAGTSSNQWIQPCPQEGMWNAPPANCAPCGPVAQPVYTPQPVQRQLAPLSWRVFGDFIYWRPSDSISYALPVNGPVVPPPTPPIPIGPVGAVDPQYDPGFRVGFGKAMDHCSEISATYTHWESDASSAIFADPLDSVALAPLVLHPSTMAADAFYTSASGSSSMKMNLVDVEYRRMIPDPSYQIGYVAGARYAQLDQDFSAHFENVATIEDVTSDVSFHGGGIRVGLEADWRSTQTGFLVYSNGYGSVVAGRFNSTYTQLDNMSTVVFTSREDGRIVPILDLEVGLGWQTSSGHIRLTAGYMFSAWLNIVSNSEFIEAVQTAQYDDLSDSLFFDGLVTRVELKF